MASLKYIYRRHEVVEEMFITPFPSSCDEYESTFLSCQDFSVARFLCVHENPLKKGLPFFDGEKKLIWKIKGHLDTRFSPLSKSSVNNLLCF